MAMKIRRESDGKTFEFNLNNIARGMWVVELTKVDDEPVWDTYSDPYDNERQARRYTRDTIERWYNDERYGWCQKHGDN